MSKDLLTRVLPSLKFTYMPFLERYLEALEKCRARGATYYAISLYRSYEEQTKLYAQGRTAAGAIVTNARAGSSAHNFGCAADCARDANLQLAGLQPTWNAKDYSILGEEVVKVGLEWAGNWKTFKEYGHVGWPGLSNPAMLKKLDVAFRKEGLQAAWALLDPPPLNVA